MLEILFLVICLHSSDEVIGVCSFSFSLSFQDWLIFSVCGSEAEVITVSELICQGVLEVLNSLLCRCRFSQFPRQSRQFEEYRVSKMRHQITASTLVEFSRFETRPSTEKFHHFCLLFGQIPLQLCLRSSNHGHPKPAADYTYDLERNYFKLAEIHCRHKQEPCHRPRPRRLMARKCMLLASDNLSSSSRFHQRSRKRNHLSAG